MLKKGFSAVFLLLAAALVFVGAVWMIDLRVDPPYEETIDIDFIAMCMFGIAGLLVGCALLLWRWAR